jgi:hypothetical protein
MFLHKVCQHLDAANIPYAIVGGYAVALHGAARGTFDVDIAIEWSLKNLAKVESALKELGLVSRLPIDANSVFHFKEEYVQKRNLIAWNFYNPRKPIEQVDIIITFDLKHHKVKSMQTQEGKVRVLAKDDLIEMKTKSGRKQDLEDVKALEAL